ncbi:putative Ufm1-specific protease [Thelohanellus kitauei]|uniref:Putative Ufm1-specific protease n=1 Tax=Thelohanellus kitauei TaxID=669202 RepID=A0A0C2MLG3_THEKT|nr:putative Ufm1-specific protease [Thelohanellus kitauei]
MSPDSTKIHKKVLELAENSLVIDNFTECGYLICSTDTLNNIHIIDVVIPSVKNNLNKFPFLLDQTFCAATVDSMLPQGIFVGGFFMKQQSLNHIGFDDLDIIERFSGIFSQCQILSCLTHFYYLLRSDEGTQLYSCKILDSNISNIPYDVVDSPSVSELLGKTFYNFNIKFPIKFIDNDESPVSSASRQELNKTPQIKFVQAIEEFFDNPQLCIIVQDCYNQDMIIKNENSNMKNLRISSNCRFGVGLSTLESSDFTNNRLGPPCFRMTRISGKSVKIMLDLQCLILMDPNFVNNQYIFDECIKSMKRQLTVLLFRIRESQRHTLPYSTFIFRFPNLDFGISCFSCNNGLDPIVQAIKNLFGINKVSNMISDLSHSLTIPFLKEYLISPHKSIKAVTDGRVYLCEGDYAYFHYGCQNVDDSGWGCAYRSFQTIFSWFVLNGLTENRSIPSIQDIQTCLYELGDQPKSIIGSSQWIGSVEIGMVLEKLLGIQYKIQPILPNQKLSEYARHIILHFEHNKCPLMIGGNNLAHTIAGVSFNSQTGDTKFLVVDPHYIGENDAKKIVSKGYVGWKTDSFWKAHQSYNIVFPIIV